MKKKVKNVEMRVLTVLAIAVISYVIFVGISPFAFTGLFVKTESLVALENIQEKVVDGKCFVDFSVVLTADENLEDVYLNLESSNINQKVVDQKMQYVGTIYGNSVVGWNDRLQVTCESGDDGIEVKVISSGRVLDRVWTDAIY